MLIETTAGDLRRVLSHIKPVIPTARNTIPMLACVLFKRGAVWASDLDREIKFKIAAKTFKGTAAIPFRRLFELISSLPQDMDVRLQAAGGPSDGIFIHFRGGRYKLPTLPAADFPTWDTIPDLKPMAAPEGFLNALGIVSGAVSTEETRYYLNGICFSKAPSGKSVLVATDGHRLIAHEYGHDLETSPILPNIALPVLFGLPDPTSIFAGGGRLSFHYPGGEFRTKLIDGTFPDWHRVTPHYDADAPALSFKPAEMVRVLNRISRVTISGHYGRCVSLSAPASGDMVVVAGKGVDSEECSERLDSGTATNWSGPADLRSFNAIYLRQLCALHRHAEQISIVAPDNGSPALLVAEDTRVLSILMPMRGDTDLISASVRAFATPDNDAANAERAA